MLAFCKKIHYIQRGIIVILVTFLLYLQNTQSREEHKHGSFKPYKKKKKIPAVHMNKAINKIRKEIKIQGKSTGDIVMDIVFT